jgi:hypothetical protein
MLKSEEVEKLKNLREVYRNTIRNLKEILGSDADFPQFMIPGICGLIDTAEAKMREIDLQLDSAAK